MQRMSPFEWNKPNSSTKEPRLDILLRAMKEGTKLVTVDNKGVVIKNSRENLNAVENFKVEGKKSFPLVTKDGRRIMSNQIGKTSIFGGGVAGAGGGTIQTAQAESLHAFYCAAVTVEGSKSIEELRPVLKKYASRVHPGGITLESAMALDEAWHVSAHLSAIDLFEKGYINRTHTFHRDDIEMNRIYKTIKVNAFKNSDMPVLPNDKWNPGDIWAIARGVDLKKTLDDSTLTNLNASLLRAFHNRSVIGISLKKVTDARKMKTVIMNPTIDRQLDKHTLSSMKLGGKSLFSNRGATYIADGKYKLEFRPDRYLSGIKVEIKHSTARGGGAGLGIITHGIKRVTGKSLYSSAEALSITKKIMAKDERSIEHFYKMAHSVRNVGKSDFLAELNTQTIDYIHSKLLATRLTYILHNSTQRERDEFVSYLINYAGSKLLESSVYVKVYQ